MKKKIQSRDKAQWSEILFDKFLFYCTCVFYIYIKFDYLAKHSMQCPLVHMRLFLGMLFLCYHPTGCFLTLLVALRHCIANESNGNLHPFSFNPHSHEEGVGALLVRLSVNGLARCLNLLKHSYFHSLKIEEMFAVRPALISTWDNTILYMGGIFEK